MLPSPQVVPTFRTWSFLSFLLAVLLARDIHAAPYRIVGTVECDVPGREPIVATLVQWNTTTAESTVLAATSTKPDGTFLLSVPSSTSPTASSRLAVIFEGPGCRPVVRTLLSAQQNLGVITMPIAETPHRSTTKVLVSGTVQLPDGSPARDAVVRLMAVQFHQFSIAPFAFRPTPASKPATSILTDVNGRFEFFLDSQPPNPYAEGLGLHLFIKHPAYAPLMLPLDAARTETILAKLPPRSVHLRGVVVDASQVPIEGADIFAASLHPDTTTVVYASTGPSGGFDVELPASDKGIRLAIDRAPFVPIEVAAEGPEWSTGSVKIQLQTGVRIRGRLLRESDGGAIPFGSVKALASDGLFALMRTGSTDTAGFYEIGGISSTHLPAYVVAEAEGFVSRELDWQEVVDPLDPFTLSAISLVRSLRLALEVQDPSRRPVRDALVVIMRSLSGPDLKAARTDASGQVVLYVAPDQYVVRVSAKDFPELFTSIDVRTSRRDRLQLTESASIRARILWADLSPAVGVKLRCLPAKPDPDVAGAFDILPDQRDVVTDQDGSFVVERLAPGPYLLQLVEAEFVGRRLEPGTWPELVIVPPGALLDVAAILPKPVSVELVLVGVPMPETLQAKLTEVTKLGEVVNEFSPVRLTVDRGRAVLAGVVPGRYSLEIALDVEATVDSRVIDITADHTSIPIQIMPGKKIYGTVNSGEGGPVTGAAVSIWLDRGDRLSFGTAPDDLTLEELTTDEQGRFATSVLREGRYLAVATKESFAPAVILFEIDNDHEPPPQTLMLYRGFNLQVDIYDASGVPAINIIGTLIRAELLPGARTFQGVQQECEATSTGCLFENITPGLYILRVVRANSREEFPLMVASPATLRVVLGQRDH